jgi:hypothetical protein
MNINASNHFHISFERGQLTSARNTRAFGRMFFQSFKVVKSRILYFHKIFEHSRHRKLKTASRSTRISMSELFRLAIDNLMLILVSPEKPDLVGLQKLLSSSEESGETASSVEDNKTEKRS